MVLAATTVLAASIAVTPASAAPPVVETVYDSMPGGQYDPCVARPSQNVPYESQLAASFVVPTATRKIEITVPVAVAAVPQVVAEASIQASRESVPWFVPDDDRVLSNRKMAVDAPYEPCQRGTLVTTSFATKELLLPGEVYWFVLRVPTDTEASVRWFHAVLGTNSGGSVAQSQYAEYWDPETGDIVTGWWSDNPELGYRAPAMRVDARY